MRFEDIKAGMIIKDTDGELFVVKKVANGDIVVDGNWKFSTKTGKLRGINTYITEVYVVQQSFCQGLVEKEQENV